METLLIVVIALALIFDFINGFHDAANSIATVVSTKVLSPLTAVLWAAMFNFLAYWIFELKVADTVAKTVHADNITLVVVIAGLVAAIIWNLVTWWFGIPSSSSHALVGGLAGAVVAHAGLDAFKWHELVEKVLVPLIASPTIGFVVAFLVMIGLMRLLRPFRPATVQRVSCQLRRPRSTGVIRVLMMNMIRVWVTIDSMNHAVWKRGTVAWKISRRMPNVRKSKIELIGPKMTTKFLMK